MSAPPFSGEMARRAVLLGFQLSLMTGGSDTSIVCMWTPSADHTLTAADDPESVATAMAVPSDVHDKAVTVVVRGVSGSIKVLARGAT